MTAELSTSDSTPALWKTKPAAVLRVIQEDVANGLYAAEDADSDIIISMNSLKARCIVLIGIEVVDLTVAQTMTSAQRKAIIRKEKNRGTLIYRCPDINAYVIGGELGANMNCEATVGTVTVEHLTQAHRLIAAAEAEHYDHTLFIVDPACAVVDSLLKS